MTNHAEAPRFIERFIEQVEEGEIQNLQDLKDLAFRLIKPHNYELEVRLEFKAPDYGFIIHGFHFWQVNRKGEKEGLVKDYEAEMQDTKKLDYRITRC